ncbi:MAG: hypothetical protein GWN58_40680, partial [Anaerolineae bacterium]|nr:hypothetical protein [Anaerolineae bacterium]
WVIDDTTTHFGSQYALSDAEHYIEVLVQYADDADAENGYATMWIDGVEQGSISSLDLSTKSQPDEARLGAIA